MGSAQRASRLPATAVAVLAAALLAACSAQPASPATGNVAATPSSSSSSSSSTPPQPAVVSVAPADRAAKVLPSTPVVVRATSGTLQAVTVVDAKGRAVKGDRSGDTWTSTSRLAPSSSYTVTVTAAGSDGATTTTRSRFSTLKPAVTATYGIVAAGQTIGVGMPVSIQFDSPVATQKLRAQVEKLVSVTTTPAQAGAWGWLDNRQLMWRPAKYWKPGTTVRVNAPLTGAQTGPGKWVANDDQATFTVGSSMISTVDIKAHTMTVRRDGKVVRVVPVSTGRPGASTETRSGVKVIIGKENHVVMDSTSIGIPKGKPGYYRTETDWNLRVTWTGEYLHSAPWSVGAQGSANVSHGCVNMSPANAQWMYQNSRVGDIVKFTGSNRPFLPTEGIGVWQYSFAQWKAQSALR